MLQLDFTEIKKYKFLQNKSSISISNKDINKITVSNKLPFCKQDFIYFIGYRYDKKVWPWCIFFQKTSSYRTDFDETWMHVFYDKRRKVFW